MCTSKRTGFLLAKIPFRGKYIRMLFIHWLCGQNSCKSSQHIRLSSIKTGHPDTFTIWRGNRKVITHIRLQSYQVRGVMWPITWCITWPNWTTHSCVPMLVEVHLVLTRASVAVGGYWHMIHHTLQETFMHVGVGVGLEVSRKYSILTWWWRFQI